MAPTRTQHMLRATDAAMLRAFVRDLRAGRCAAPGPHIGGMLAYMLRRDLAAAVYRPCGSEGGTLYVECGEASARVSVRGDRRIEVMHEGATASPPRAKRVRRLRH